MREMPISPAIRSMVEQTARSLYRSFWMTGVSLDDLIQEGFIGYLTSVHKAGPCPDHLPQLYLTRVRGAMLDYIRATIPFICRLYYWRRKVRRITAALREENGATPNLEEVAQRAGVYLADLKMHLTLAHRASTLVLEMMPARTPEETAEQIIQRLIRRTKLSESELRILELLADDKRRIDISREFGVSEGRISQRVKLIVAKLRRTAARDNTPHYTNHA